MRSLLSRQLFRAIQQAIQLEELAQRGISLSDAEELEAWTQTKPLTLNRRRFLTQAGLLGLTGALVGTEAFASTNNPKTQQEKVLIVGGGLAGLTAAHRLLQKGIPVVLYEANTRLGGRTHTKRNFNTEGMFCELGGELVNSTHTQFRALCKQLGVTLVNKKPYSKGRVHDTVYTNGRHWTNKELVKRFQPLSKHLLRVRKVLTDSSFPTITYKKASPQAIAQDKIHLRDYLLSVPGLDPIIRDIADLMLRTEYGLPTHQQSSLNFILAASATPQKVQWVGGSDEAYGFKHGTIDLVSALVQKVRQKGTIHLDQALLRINKTSDGFALTFGMGLGGKGSSHTVKAKQVVLALPFSSLRRVDGIDKLGLSQAKERSIMELGYGTNAKMMLGFSSRPWRQASIKRSAQTNQQGHTGTCTSTLASEGVWDTSLGQAGKQGILTSFTGGYQGKELQRLTQQQMLQDVETLFPGSRAAFNGRHARFLWVAKPTSLGSYSCPMPGQLTRFIGCEAQTECKGTLFFAGEHTDSANAGFMEGAVGSGERVAKEIIASRQAKKAKKTKTSERSKTP